MILAVKDCDHYFAEDGVHFDYYSSEESMRSDPTNQPGLQRIAEELDKKIRDMTRGSTWKSAQTPRTAIVQLAPVDQQSVPNTSR